QRAVQTVLEEQLTLPAHDVREEVAEVRGVVVEERRQVKLGLGRCEVVETYLGRRDLGPCALCQPMVRVGTPFAHPPKDHPSSVDSNRPRPCMSDGSLGP